MDWIFNKMDLKWIQPEKSGSDQENWIFCPTLMMCWVLEILDINNWIRFWIPIYFFGRISLDFLKIQIQIFGSRFKSGSNSKSRIYFL